MLYFIVRLTTKILLPLLTRYRVKGGGNIPSHGPVIIIANHLTLIDPPLLSARLHRRAMFMAKEELFRSKLSSYIMTSLHAFPVSKGRLDRQALRRAMQVLADGMILVIFPEGTRSHGRQLKAAFSGVALIASRGSAPIVPIGITGTEKLKGLSWLWRRPKITVNIGQPFSLPSSDSRLTKAELSSRTDVIMGHLARLLPVEYRGYYAAERPDGIRD